MKTIFLSVFFVTAPAAVAAQVVVYEGVGGFPDELGWTRDDFPYLPQRWLEDGWFVEEARVASRDPYVEENDVYRHSLAALAGSPSFFAECRVVTDGINKPLQVASAVFVAANDFGVAHHFVISRDRLRFSNSYAQLRYYPLDPEMTHTYGLEIRQLQYRVLLDGNVINMGTLPGPYPTSDSEVLFAVRASGNPDPVTTRWDYIRFGVIPGDAGAGDLNCDGTINQFDINPFIAALVSADGYGQAHPACNRLLADTNADGSVNQFDIIPFVDLLLP